VIVFEGHEWEVNFLVDAIFEMVGQIEGMTDEGNICLVIDWTGSMCDRGTLHLVEGYGGHPSHIVAVDWNALVYWWVDDSLLILVTPFPSGIAGFPRGEPRDCAFEGMSDRTPLRSSLAP
jgi:hypothetical protein